MKKFLSAEALHLLKTTSGRTLPKRGLKSDVPINELLETNQVDQLLQERASVISEAKVERLSCLLHGEWLPDVKLVVISKNQGNYLRHMGHTLNGQNMLYPEEALYLMDINCMEVYYNDLPISMQEAYGLFLQTDLTLEKYQVYAHLSRLGYIVVRHQGQLNKEPASACCNLTSAVTYLDDNQNRPTSSKRPIENSDYGTWPQKKMKLLHGSTLSDNVSKPCLLVKHPEIRFPNIIGRDVVMLSCPDKSLLPPNISMPSEKIIVDLKLICSSGNTRPIVLEDRSSHNEFRAERSPCIRYDCAAVGGQTFTQALDSRYQNRPLRGADDISWRTWVPRSERCEDNWRTNTHRFLGASQDLRKRNQVHRHSNWRIQRQTREDCDNIIELQRSLVSSEGVSSTSSGRTSAQCWKDYKKEISNYSRSSDHHSNIVDILSTPRIQPLITPSDMSSTSFILDKLTVIQQVRHDRFTAASKLPGVAFDVYLPNTDYKKTMPQLPNHRIVVTRIEDPLPNIDLIEQNMQSLGDEVGLNFAVVDNGNVAFYSFNDVNLPRQISMG